jgi:ABC-type sugar transport system permease subunit
VAYLFDRVGRWRQINWKQWIIELPVLALALARTQFPVPLISGHALFLAYAFLTTRSTIARWTAAVVFIQVLCLKILWLDVTLIGGTLVGGIAALVVNRYLRETGDG